MAPSGLYARLCHAFLVVINFTPNFTPSMTCSTPCTKYLKMDLSNLNSSTCVVHILLETNQFLRVSKLP